jgi:hypothetical protein
MIGKVASIADRMIVTKVVGGEMISVDGMARKSTPAKSVSGEAVRTKSVTHMDRTMGSKAMKAVEAAPAKSMEPTASAKSMEPTASAKSMPTASAATPSACKRRDVRHDAKRDHRNARRQNAYCSFAHSAIPIRSLDRWRGGACITAQTSPHLTFNY